MDRKSETQFLRNLPPVIELVVKKKKKKKTPELELQNPGILCHAFSAAL